MYFSICMCLLNFTTTINLLISDKCYRYKTAVLTKRAVILLLQSILLKCSHSLHHLNSDYILSDAAAVQLFKQP